MSLSPLQLDFPVVSILPLNIFGVAGPSGRGGAGLRIGGVEVRYCEEAAHSSGHVLTIATHPRNPTQEQLTRV